MTKRDKMEEVEQTVLSLPNDSIRTMPIKFNSHVFYLDEDVGDPSMYRDITHMLLTCSPEDTVSIIINSCGGRLDSACQLMEAIEACQGKVQATVIGAAYSAASMIACVVPEVRITDSAEMMIHTAAYGTVGTVPNVKAHTDFITAQVNNLIDKVYGDFLTPDEIRQLKNGKEFWFGAEEARRRFEHREKVRLSGYKKQLAAVKKEVQELVKDRKVKDEIAKKAVEKVKAKTTKKKKKPVKK